MSGHGERARGRAPGQPIRGQYPGHVIILNQSEARRASHPGTYSLLFLAVITSLIVQTGGHSEFHTGPRLISPRLYHARHKRELRHTRDLEEEGRHVHHLTVAWDIGDEDFVLDLELNRDLIPDTYWQKYHNEVRNITSNKSRYTIIMR